MAPAGTLLKNLRKAGKYKAAPVISQSSVKTPSDHLSLQKLKEIRDANYFGTTGKNEYAAGEVDDRIYQLQSTREPEPEKTPEKEAKKEFGVLDHIQVPEDDFWDGIGEFEARHYQPTHNYDNSKKRLEFITSDNPSHRAVVGFVDARDDKNPKFWIHRKLKRIEPLASSIDFSPPPPPPPPAATTATVSSSSSSPYAPAPLQRLAALESANHTQRVHPVQTNNIHSGTRAVSSYGLMPVTLKEIAAKHAPLRESPLGQKILQSGSPEEINKITYDRQNDDVLAQHAWDYTQARILKNLPELNKDQLEILSVYAHRNGINAALRAFKSDLHDKHPYVQKYLRLKMKDGLQKLRQILAMR